MLRFLTAGESHGRLLTAIIDGLPSGLPVEAARIDLELRRRQGGYGRGGRMKIEKDAVEIASGVRWSRTLGSPVTLIVRNRDWENWEEVMAPEEPQAPVDYTPVTRPRPGHADLTGGIKYGHRDLRNVLERSSARETAARVAVGAVARSLLSEVGVGVYSWVTGIGELSWAPGEASAATLHGKAERSEVRCPDPAAGSKMIKRIERAKKDGDSLGGVFTVAVTGVPPGLGSHTQWDRKLDGRLAGSLMSIQAIKGVEVGMGFGAARTPGSGVHDEIYYRKAGRRGTGSSGGFWPREPRFYRKTNNAGGIEGGMSNGEPIVVSAAMKPIPTLYRPLKSVDIESKKAFKASVERSDVCAVPAASVVAEAVVAFEVASVFLEKFSGDTLEEVKRNYLGYLDEVCRF